MIGFLEAFFGTVFAGLRWSLTQILLERKSLGMNPIATNFNLTPLTTLSLALAVQIVEGFSTIFASPFFLTWSTTLSILTYISLGGIMAFFMVLLEFKLILITSVVTFSVAGLVKEILQITVSHILFHDEFTFWNILGLVISIIGIAGYNYMRFQAMRNSSNQGFTNLVQEPERGESLRHLPPSHRESNESDSYQKQTLDTLETTDLDEVFALESDSE